MKFEHFIALRYLTSKKQIGFVTTISIISVAGVTIGVAALIIVLSVFNGFNELVTSLLVTFDPHLQVERIVRSEKSGYDSLTTFLDQFKEVQGYGEYVSGKSLIVSRNLNRVVNIKGIEQEKAAVVSGLPNTLKYGKMNLGGERSNGIVIGLNLADRLGSVTGDTLAVVGSAGSDLALLQMTQPLIRRFHVTGIYESNNKDYDACYAFVNLEAGRALFGLGQAIDGIEVRLHDPDHADYLKRMIQKKFGGVFRIATWFDLHKELYTVMQVERWSAYVILCLIIAVASFNLLGSLTMSVVEKTRDIGILKSMGATAKSIRTIFMSQGVAVGVLGTLLGLGLGLGVVYLQRQYHLFPLDPTVYIIPAIPVVLRVTDLFIIAFAAIGLCFVATLHPSKRASDLVPGEAIRWE
jgi:lipoprotein-releasing system permease protein